VIETIHVNDIVELWCCGASVPGAWLESYVRKIRDGKYCVGEVLASGNLWVDRDRIRLVKSAAANPSSSALVTSGSNSFRNRLAIRFSITQAVMLSPRSSVDSNESDEDLGRSSCSIM
jgi:hypothetical protein